MKPNPPEMGELRDSEGLNNAVSITCEKDSGGKETRSFLSASRRGSLKSSYSPQAQAKAYRNVHERKDFPIRPKDYWPFLFACGESQHGLIENSHVFRMS